MKILIAHNNYGKYSGEEAVVDGMVSMLEAMGHDVAQLRMTTEGLQDSATGKMRAFFAGIYSPAGIRAMREALEREKPDIVNIHNLYPFISPAALRECHRHGIPVVMTIHNFRLICPTGLFMRDNAPCEHCLKAGNEWGCIRYNCEHSRLKSVGYALRNMAARWRGDYKKHVTRFACITAFQRRKLIEAGFDSDRIEVIPNSIHLNSQFPIPDSQFNYVAYSGRISKEKGVDMIINVARRHPEMEFRLAGAVRDEELVEDLPGNVRLMGYMTGEALADFYRGARFFVMASRWYEGFPMTILEAGSHGKAMVGPDHGGFTEIIGRGDDAIGMLTLPGDVDSLEKAIVKMWATPGLAEELGQKARCAVEARYSTPVIADQWSRLLEELKKCHEE